jgi:hypothetical protein
MDVVSMDYIGEEAVDRVLNLFVGDAAAEQPPGRVCRSALGARGLERFDVVAALREQALEIRHRALLSPLGSVSVVQE